jgi:2'-5' RNA ligase
MRLFVAVEVGNEAVQFAADVRAALDRLDPGLCRRGLKWVDGSNLHLTLRFIGEVDDRVGGEVEAALRAPLAMSPFRLELGSPAWLPGPDRPRVLMLPVSAEGITRLSALKRAIDQRLPRDVPAEEPRPFRPHLTLARVRDDWRDRARRGADAWAHLATSVPGGIVSRAVLFRSNLRSQGPRYAERAHAALEAS